MSSNNPIRQLALAAMFLALALVLPFVTGQIPQIGGALCPMHLPVLLCGFFCDPLFALAVGAIAPLLRFFLFGMPPLLPTGLAMSLELATYGLTAAMLSRRLPRTRWGLFLALLGAMLAGRAVWGVASALIFGIRGTGFGWKLFFMGAFGNAIPGIALQMLLIPQLVYAIARKK